MQRFLFGIVTILGALAFSILPALAQDDYYETGEYDAYYEDSGPYDEETYDSGDAYDRGYEYHRDDYRRGGVEFSIFYSSLSPHGRWVYRSPYGRVWIPRVGHGWRPYTIGHWVYTHRYGWLWVSHEPWGWATFHYGWWEYDPYFGWFWVPGYVWSPAWVVWRWGYDSIGWAPIFASSVWGRSYSDIFIHRRRYPHVGRREAWCFVRAHDFGDRELHRHIFDARGNEPHLRNSKTVFNLGIENNRFVNRGIDLKELEQRTGRRFHWANVREVSRPTNGSNSDVVEVFKPIETPVSSERPFVFTGRPGRGRDAGDPSIAPNPGDANLNVPWRRRKGEVMPNVDPGQGIDDRSIDPRRRWQDNDAERRRDWTEQNPNRWGNNQQANPNAGQGQQTPRPWRNRRDDQDQSDHEAAPQNDAWWTRRENLRPRNVPENFPGDQQRTREQRRADHPPADYRPLQAQQQRAFREQQPPPPPAPPQNLGRWGQHQAQQQYQRAQQQQQQEQQQQQDQITPPPNRGWWRQKD